MVLSFTTRRVSLVNLGWKNESTGKQFNCRKDDFQCRYVNGTHLLVEKYSYPGVTLENMTDVWTNTAINFPFPCVVMIANRILYLVSLLAFVKAKFR